MTANSLRASALPNDDLGKAYFFKRITVISANPHGWHLVIPLPSTAHQK